MKVAVLADLHGNFEAFQTCVQYALEKNITQFIFLGDYIGEFAFPQKTMELLYQMKDSYSCTFIKGNKEDYWLYYNPASNNYWKEFDSTTGSLMYAYQNLTKKDLEFFSSLEIATEVQYPGTESITICHGTPFKTNEKLVPDDEKTLITIEQCKTKLLLCGHTHMRRTIQHNGKKVINPGSVGMPLRSGGQTQFMILNWTEDGWQEEFISLDYDMEREIKSLYLANLDKLAPYWCKTTEQVLRTGMHSHSVVLDKAMKLCKEDQGVCNWPLIPEKYWKKAFYEIYGEN